MASHYKAKALGETHQYSLVDGMLSVVSSGAPELRHEMRLDVDGVKLATRTIVHNAFWGGVFCPRQSSTTTSSGRIWKSDLVAGSPDTWTRT